MHMVRLFDNELKENEKDFNKIKEIKNKKIFKKTLYLSLSYMKYNINSSIGEFYKENYANKLIR